MSERRLSPRLTNPSTSLPTRHSSSAPRGGDKRPNPQRMCSESPHPLPSLNDLLGHLAVSHAPARVSSVARPPSARTTCRSGMPSLPAQCSARCVRMSPRLIIMAAGVFPHETLSRAGCPEYSKPAAWLVTRSSRLVV